jgi:hypothetical protein
MSLFFIPEILNFEDPGCKLKNVDCGSFNEQNENQVLVGFLYWQFQIRCVVVTVNSTMQIIIIICN